MNIIFAQDRDGVFAVDGKLPWHCPGDLRFFKHMTQNKRVIMGVNTFMSIPVDKTKEMFLGGRMCFVASGGDGVTAVCQRLRKEARMSNNVVTLTPNQLRMMLIERHDDVCVIGGKALIESAMWYAWEIIVSTIDSRSMAKATLDQSAIILAPSIPRAFTPVETKQYTGFSVTRYVRGDALPDFVVHGNTDATKRM